jgi:outer membrane protein
MKNLSASTLAARVLVPLLLSLTAAAREVPEGAPASTPRGPGLSLGVRGALGVPLGKLSESSFRTVFTSAIAPQLDLGWFFGPNLYAGGYFQYGPAKIYEDNCLHEERNCRGTLMRVGFDVSYHLSPEAAFSPWLGVGAGYEVATDHTVRGLSGKNVFEGFELAHAQAGLDLQVTRAIRVGPYFLWTAGVYSKRTSTVAGVETSRELSEKSLHFWLQPGLRLQFRL